MLVKRKIGELRVSELRTELEKRNLDNKGLKSTLLQRLQKAITDEGGDVDQIEIEMMAAPSPGSKKNSPRIKRISEPSSENEKTSLAAKEMVGTPIIPEKSAGGSDDNHAKIEGSSLHASDNTDEQPKQETEVKDRDLTAASLRDEGDLELLESTGNETGSELTVLRGDTTLMHGEREIDATNTENVLNQDSLVIKDDINRTEITAYEPDERFMEDDYADRYEGAFIDAANGDGENIQVKITSEGEFTEQHGGGRHGDQPDDQEETGEHSPTDDPDIVLEDDVLDMLDYDIEMPDQSQVDNTDDFHESNEEGDVKDDKAVDGSGKTDSAESVKDKKDSAATDDEKEMKNLWITGLSATTRASELKVAFSRYGKVVGAKVVTNARSPGSKCYGFVAMATADAAKKCIIHLHKTEMHGRMITVEYTKNDPSTRKPVGSRPENRSQSAGKISQSSENSSLKELSGSRRSTSDLKDGSKEDSSHKRMGSDSIKRRLDESRSGDRRNRKSPIIERTRDGTRLTRRPGVTRRESPTEPHRKRLRPGERKVMLDNKRGEMSLRVNVRSMQERRPNPPRRRLSPSPLRLVRPPRTEERPRRLLPPDSPRLRDRGLGREREPIRPRARDAREEISRRKGAADALRPNRSLALQASIERDRLLLRKEREERDFLRMERERLERERRQLERDRIERERLEQERLKLEHERKRELEKIEREKEEMKRLQEINRFEQSQRQRALKRMYDGRPHDDRNEGKRVDRDDRRRYDNESRERPMDGFYRNDEGSFRPGRAGGPGRTEKVNFHDVDRRNLSSHNDTDARYPSGSGRRVEKYERPAVKPADFDRRSGDGVAGGLSYRHHEKEVADDRKVVARDRGRPTAGSFRRDDGPLSKKEAMPSLRGGSASSRPRAGDRDLREEIRQGTLSGGTRKGSPHRTDLRHRDEPPSGRGASRAEPQLHGNTPIQSGPPGGKPIPTTGRAGMGFQPSSSWPWQERGETNAIWHGATNAIAGAGAPVGRMVAPPIGLPFNPLAAVNPPQVGAEAGLISHNISTGFPQSRIDNFKPIRRF